MSALGFQPGNRRGNHPPPGGVSTIQLGDDTDTWGDNRRGAIKSQPAQEQQAEQKVQEPVEMEIDDDDDDDDDDPTSKVAQSQIDPAIREQIQQALNGATTVGQTVEALHGSLKKVEHEVTSQQGQTTGQKRDLVRKIRFPMDDPVDRKCQQALDKLRKVLKSRGSHGIIGLGKKFRSMDDSGNGQLEYEEFKKAMKEMDFEAGELDGMFRYMDFDCSGSISFNEFLEVVKGPMSKRRVKMVMKAFKVLDKTKDGKVDLDDLQGRYDVRQHPDFIAGIKTRDEILSEFLSNFERSDNPDGVITPEEFVKYYNQISASIDDDDYFELMIRNVWHISGGEGWAANTTCKRVLVTHEDNTMSVQEVTDDFDIDVTDVNAIKQKLIEQGISVKKVSLYGSMEESSAPTADSSGPAQGSTARDAKQRNLGSSIIF